MDRDEIGKWAILGGVALLAYGLLSRSKKGNGVFGYARGRQKMPALIDTTRSGNMTTRHYRDPNMPIQQRVAILQDLVWKGAKNPEMRALALAITGYGKRTVKIGRHVVVVQGANCEARDGECEARAIYNWVRDPRNARYTGDIAPLKMGRKGPVEGIDLFQSANRTVEIGGGDCLPVGTLLLAEGYRFVPIENLLPGTKIWGRNKWTTVQDVWPKGELPVDVVYLNNGSSFKATSDHKIYVAICRHDYTWNEEKRCSCPMSSRSIERIRLADAKPGMVVVSPERIDFGTDEMSADRAYIEGLYLADGWCSHDQSFDIAGKDGHPKESQKHAIKEICDQLGISTYWHERYIRIKDGDWTRRVSQMGHKAWLKHAPSIDLTQEAAESLLRGIMADSGANTNGNGRTFTTTSRELMLQVRMLHKMLGQTCSERYIVDHGGLGEHPIWRLGVRDTNRSDGNAVKLLRIKDIERAVVEMPVYDLTTEDHYVYLPEADITVSNCDDHSVLIATLLTLNGITAKFRITAAHPGSDWGHIYSVAGIGNKNKQLNHSLQVVSGMPKNNPKKWVVLDSTLPGQNYNVEARYARHADFDV